MVAKEAENGYYVCECGQKYLSNFPFIEANCLNCQRTIKRKEILKGNYSRLLKKLKNEGKL